MIKVVEICFDFKSVFSDLTVKNFLVISKFKERKWVGGGKVIFFLKYTWKNENSARIYYINMFWVLFCQFYNDLGQHFISEKCVK